MSDTLSICLDQFKRYSAPEVRALVNALYQSEFVCGHLRADPAQEYPDDDRAADCPTAQHCGAFHAVSAPAFCAICSTLRRYLPVFAAIDRLMEKNRPVRIAIEGHSASGKSSLAALLSRVYDCNVFHMDDFFLQVHQRTPERYAQPGGNVDYERFHSEVLTPLSEGKPFSFRPFDCSTLALKQPVSITPKQLTIVEGVYSLHPELAHLHDLGIFLEISEEAQRERILRRNGPEMLERFVSLWIPLEKLYFDQTGTRSRCIIHIDDADSQHENIPDSSH